MCVGLHVQCIVLNSGLNGLGSITLFDGHDPYECNDKLECMVGGYSDPEFTGQSFEMLAGLPELADKIN